MTQDSINFTLALIYRFPLPRLPMPPSGARTQRQTSGEKSELPSNWDRDSVILGCGDGNQDYACK